jgi:hypothetical protein
MTDAYHAVSAIEAEAAPRMRIADGISEEAYRVRGLYMRPPAGSPCCSSDYSIPACAISNIVSCRRSHW